MILIIYEAKQEFFLISVCWGGKSVSEQIKYYSKKKKNNNTKNEILNTDHKRHNTKVRQMEK